MTTTAYDMRFLASDIAFTDNQGNVTLDVPFRKVKRIGSVVVGMAGCLACMVDFSNSVLGYATGQIDDLIVPDTILARTDRDFVALLYTTDVCLKLTKKTGSNDIELEDVTSSPTVIGSGGDYVRDGFLVHQNGVVAVLEATKHDKHTAGSVKYCSVSHDNIHNLEVHAMSKDLKLEITGLQAEVVAAEQFLAVPANEGKSFHASTKTYSVGEPKAMKLEDGMTILKRGLAGVRDAYKK